MNSRLEKLNEEIYNAEKQWDKHKAINSRSSLSRKWRSKYIALCNEQDALFEELLKWEKMKVRNW